MAKPLPITLVTVDSRMLSIEPACPLTRSRSLSFTTSGPKFSCRRVNSSRAQPCSSVAYCGMRFTSRPICTTTSGYSSRANSSTAAITARIISNAAAPRGMPSRWSRVVGGSSA